MRDAFARTTLQLREHMQGHSPGRNCRQGTSQWPFAVCQYPPTQHPWAARHAGGDSRTNALHRKWAHCSPSSSDPKILDRTEKQEQFLPVAEIGASLLVEEMERYRTYDLGEVTEAWVYKYLDRIAEKLAVLMGTEGVW